MSRAKKVKKKFHVVLGVLKVRCPSCGKDFRIKVEKVSEDGDRARALLSL